jgi:hypothetical protein
MGADSGDSWTPRAGARTAGIIMPEAAVGTGRPESMSIVGVDIGGTFTDLRMGYISPEAARRDYGFEGT